MEKTKKCGKCGDNKKISEFTYRNKKKGILQNACKLCWVNIRKKSYEKNKNTTYEKNKRLRIRNSKWLKKYKTKIKCNRCDETHIATLEFHHKDSTEKKYSIAKMMGGFSIKNIVKEINKCEVLCANCHAKLHYNEKHPNSLIG